MDISLTVVNGKDVRSLEFNGETCYVSTESAYACGYVNPSQAIKNHVDNKNMLSFRMPDRLGRVRKTKLISQAGLDQLLVKSGRVLTKQTELVKLTSQTNLTKVVSQTNLTGKVNEVTNKEVMDKLVSVEQTLEDILTFLTD